MEPLIGHPLSRRHARGANRLERTAHYYTSIYLPYFVIQDPTLLVVLSAYRDRERCAAMRHDWRNGGPVLQEGMQPLLTGEVESIYLRPTARSLIRYHGDGAP